MLKYLHLDPHVATCAWLVPRPLPKPAAVKAGSSPRIFSDWTVWLDFFLSTLAQRTAIEATTERLSLLNLHTALGKVPGHPGSLYLGIAETRRHRSMRLTASHSSTAAPISSYRRLNSFWLTAFTCLWQGKTIWMTI